jgi:DNA mismatch repair protein MutL
MSKIKRLSNNTINLIAAGEVVEKPSSVIKELVENSIDAGASEVDILIDRSGKNKITIIDNGFGMSRDDLLISIERHTTSKLDESDITDIKNFGFRGEALASIASVSRIKISSRAAGAPNAYMLFKHDSGDLELIEDNIPHGTKIEISDLFFSTPARLKFLKSDNSELAACLDAIKKLAIAHPQIAFSTTSNEKLAFKYHASNLADRIGKILPKDFIENSSEINFERDGIKIRGFVSIPTYNKATAGEQYLFVNNRPVKDKLLIAAVKVAYKDFVEDGRHPVVVIFIDIDHQSIDVNVHPAKIEIRFQDPNLIRGLLVAAIRDALGRESHKTSTTISKQAMNFFQAPGLSLGSRALENNSLCEESSPFHYQSILTAHRIQGSLDFARSPIPREIPIFAIESQTESQPEHSLGLAVAQFYNTYIISQTSDSIILIDQHAAHERLVYEDIKIQLSERGITRQALLIPEVIEFKEAKFAHKIYEKRDELLNLGLLVELDAKSIIVREVPALLGEFDIRALILDLGDYLIEYDENFALSHLIEHVTETYACHHSIRAGRKMNLTEMNDLIRKMEATPFSGQCNHGRPTYLKLGRRDIEKLFGR